MRQLPTALLPLCMCIASAQAADEHELYVLKTADGVYAYDAADIDVSPRTGLKTLTIAMSESDGENTSIFTIDCRRKLGMFGGAISTDGKMQKETLTMVEGNGNESRPDDPQWRPISETAAMKIAAAVACRQRLAGAVRVDSQQAAFEELKNLSN